MFFEDEPFTAQIVKRTLDGCAGKVQFRSDRVHCKPAAPFRVGMILQTAVDRNRSVSQTGIVDGIVIVYQSSPGLSLNIGLRGKGARSSRNGGCDRSGRLGTGAGCFFKMAASSSSLLA